MGEEIPQTYLKIEQSILSMREEFKSLPLMKLKEEFLPRIKKDHQIEEEEIKRAVSLLHSWGECIHFESSPILSEYIILDPAFLTQEILSSLFHPDYKNFFPNGRLNHQDLKFIWPKYQDKSAFLIALMEKFEVCFELNPNSSEDFFSRESIITSYLPEDPPEEFTSNWTEACPKDTYQLSNKYQFNIIPKELVSRLLVRDEVFRFLLL